MIEVRLKKLRPIKKEGTSDLLNIIDVTPPNESAEGAVKAIRKKIKDKKCKKHPNITSIITISADIKKYFKIKKTFFCCPEFENQIEIKIQKD